MKQTFLINENLQRKKYEAYVKCIIFSAEKYKQSAFAASFDSMTMPYIQK